MEVIMHKIFSSGLLAIGLLLTSVALAQNNQPPAETNSGPDTSASDSLQVPSGTQISVRTNEAIDASQATVGQTYSAEVAEDVRGTSGTNGEILIPQKSEAQLVIRQVSGGGTVGTPELALDLQSLTVNGRRYEVSTADLSRSTGKQGIGKNKRTAEMVGGGALLGTLVGAIAGGGKGAAIGAVAGAATGGTAQVLTRGKQVKVPAETVLRFQLDQPLLLHSID
jgi:hypothetical protein